MWSVELCDGKLAWYKQMAAVALVGDPSLTPLPSVSPLPWLARIHVTDDPISHQQQITTTPIGTFSPSMTLTSTR